MSAAKLESARRIFASIYLRLKFLTRSFSYASLRAFLAFSAKFKWTTFWKDFQIYFILVTKKISRKRGKKASHFAERSARIRLFGWKSSRSKNLRHMRKPRSEKLWFFCEKMSFRKRPRTFYSFVLTKKVRQLWLFFDISGHSSTFADIYRHF